MKYCLFLLFLSCSVGLASAQSLESITVSDGLSQGMINDILKDSDGFMWFATNNGLNRYDGHTFKVYTHNPFDSLTISGDEISCLLEESEDYMWVGTISHGLNLFDRKRDIFYPITVEGTRSSDLPASQIFSIAKDTAGSLWIGTYKGVYKLKLTQYPASGKPPQFEAAFLPLPDGIKNNVNSVLCTSTGTVLIRVVGYGIFSWNVYDERFEPVVLNSGTDELWGRKMTEYPSGTVWASSNLGLIQYRDKKEPLLIKNAKKPFLSSVYDLAVLKDREEIWFSTGFDSRIYSFDPTQAADQLQFDPVLDVGGTTRLVSMYLDDHKTLWIGTNGYGIYKYQTQSAVFEHLDEGNSVIYINEINGHLFTASRLWASAYSTQKKRFLPLSEEYPLPDDIRGLYQAKDGTIWAVSHGSPAQLYQLDTAFEIQQTYLLEDLYPLFGQIIEDAKGKLWFPGNTEAFLRFDPLTGKSQPVSCTRANGMPVMGSPYFCFYKDRQGNLWKGGPKGLAQLKLDQNSQPSGCRFFNNDPNNAQSLSHNSVASCLDDPADPDTYLWVGTKGGGLNKLNKQTGQCEHFTTAQGLPDNVVYGVLADEEGYLWLSTNRGLSRFDPRREVFRNYKVEDGLQATEFNTGGFFKNEASGKLFFGGVNGVTAFFPDQIKPDPYVPPVHITGLHIHNEEVAIGQPLEDEQEPILKASIASTERIDLDWHQNHVTLEFTALDYTIPEKTQYQYRLSSVDRDWVRAGTDRSVTYANLVPGEYLFEVKGSNSSGVWNEQPAQLRIVIHPPWWRTTWAYAAYLLLFSGAVIALYRFQLNRNKLRNQLAFEQKEAERLSELDRIKTNFFSNVTHEFRTPLTLIIEPIRQLIAEHSDKKAQGRLKMALKNSEHLLLLVNQLMDLSKLESKQMQQDLRRADIGEVFREVYRLFLPLAEKKAITLKLSAPPSITPSYFDKNKLEKVFYNLLSNAVKFTPEGGQVQAALSEVEQKQQAFFKIKVTDTGIGIRQEDLPRIFDRFYQVNDSSVREHEGTGIGLALTKELIELMDGTISVESQYEKGTTFELLLPVRNELETVGERKAEPPTPDPAFSLPPVKAPENGPEEATPASMDGELILVIEDNTDLRQFICQSLPAHFQPVEAINGEDGLQKAIKLIPDLIISDIMMPRLNGFALTEKLRKDERTAHIPIILLTAKSTLDSIVQGIGTGADAYLTKPFSVEELTVRIRKLIEMRRQLQQKYSTQQTTAPQSEPPSGEHPFLQKLQRGIQKNLNNEDLSVEELAQEANMSRTQLHRKLKALTGQSASTFIRNYRLDAARHLLQEGTYSVKEISMLVGFKNQTYFSTKFKERFGQPPSAFHA
ncbi:MAG: helix-turn-helix domain-containing protein [Bacteroidetes bacterium]|nr:helix-turn-helix domain-containing protein [Bacteroidota bacterium]